MSSPSRWKPAEQSEQQRAQINPFSLWADAPYHIVKLPDQCGAYVHFVNEVDAATFFWRYALQRRVICASLASVGFRSSLGYGVPTDYNTVGMKSHPDSSFCECALEDEQQPEATSSSNNNSTSITIRFIKKNMIIYAYTFLISRVKD
ncbi:unnamed protein product [Rhizopus microsporus]